MRARYGANPGCAQPTSRMHATPLIIICNLFAQNFYWHFYCLPFAIPALALCTQLLLALKLPAICNQLALCILLLLAIYLPAICNPLASCTFQISAIYLHSTGTCNRVGILLTHATSLTTPLDAYSLPMAARYKVKACGKKGGNRSL